MKSSFVFLDVPATGQLMGWYPRVDRRFGTEQWELPEALTTLESLFRPLSGLVGQTVFVRERTYPREGLRWEPWKQTYNDFIGVFFTRGYKIGLAQQNDAPGRYTATDEIEVNVLWIIHSLSSHFKILPRVVATWIPETRVLDPTTGLWRGEAHVQIELQD